MQPLLSVCTKLLVWHTTCISTTTKMFLLLVQHCNSFLSNKAWSQIIITFTPLQAIQETDLEGEGYVEFPSANLDRDADISFGTKQVNALLLLARWLWADVSTFTARFTAIYIYIKLLAMRYIYHYIMLLSCFGLHMYAYHHNCIEMVAVW